MITREEIALECLKCFLHNGEHTKRYEELMSESRCLTANECKKRTEDDLLDTAFEFANAFLKHK